MNSEEIPNDEIELVAIDINNLPEILREEEKRSVLFT